ncbi:hypothetical protein DH2020_020840 [Rehmannia glutinosa]|uniref:Uncharacterized protein n=1 Tax=Rehmannia glutinosa TaxID=99300 RepID=A0ABR0WA53_REHGL
MEELDDQESPFGSALPPALVSLTAFTPSVSPSIRRLSSCFTQPSKPIRAKRQLAWVSLQGRLVGAEEATSAKTVDKNGAFCADEAAAWELFSPIQRVLIVAVIAAAAIDSRKNKQIFKLQKFIEIRDQVLLSMQQKLETLCQKVNYFKDQPEIVTSVDVSVTKRTNCGCEPYVEPEERRMSDLSDWASSITSSIDIQLDNLASEHDMNSLQNECEEKDVTIKKLSTLIQSSEVLSSKGVFELEDIIRRKNTIIHKLRKDIFFLEQKVMNQARLKRPSCSAANSNIKQLPVMADNVLYDMDSTTSPSSSNSDISPRNQIQCQGATVQISKKDLKGDQNCGQFKRSCTLSPLKERSLNQTPNSLLGLRIKQNSTGENRTRRRPPARSKEVIAPRRWV